MKRILGFRAQAVERMFAPADFEILCAILVEEDGVDVWYTLTEFSGFSEFYKSDDCLFDILNQDGEDITNEDIDYVSSFRMDFDFKDKIVDGYLEEYAHYINEMEDEDLKKYLNMLIDAQKAISSNLYE